jgi:predicted DNA-binding transcriptional regulator YafY
MRLILGALARRGNLGITRRRLEQAAGITGKDPSRALKRDLANLRRAGWDIRTVERGGQWVYVLHVVDPRVRRNFSDAERAQLLRAAQTAGLGQLYEDLDPRGADGTAGPVDEVLGLAQEAVASRCLVRFEYKHKSRTAHPYTLNRRDKGWLLRARETSGDVVKNFYVDQVQNLELDAPGTAEAVPDDLPQMVLDPMRWQVHPVVPVVVETAGADVAEVVQQLGSNGHRVLQEDGRTLVEVDVTNTEGFLPRLFEMGTRVRLVGPDEVRRAAAEQLRAVIGGA